MTKSADAFRTISEVAELLDTPAHVLRFWESRFPQIKPVKRAGGRRYYRPADVALLAGIKALLHEDGLTIRGVQKLLKDLGPRHVAAMAETEERPGSAQPTAANLATATDPETGLALPGDEDFAQEADEIALENSPESRSALPPARIAPTTVEALNTPNLNAPNRAETPPAEELRGAPHTPRETVTPLDPAARRALPEQESHPDPAPDRASDWATDGTPHKPMAPPMPPRETERPESSISPESVLSASPISEFGPPDAGLPDADLPDSLADSLSAAIPGQTPPDAPKAPIYADPVQEYDEAPMILDAQDEPALAEVIRFASPFAQDSILAAQLDLFGEPIAAEPPAYASLLDPQEDDAAQENIAPNDTDPDDTADAAAYEDDGLGQSDPTPPALAQAATAKTATAKTGTEDAVQASPAALAAAPLPAIGAVAKALRGLAPASLRDSDRDLARDLLARATGFQENLRARPRDEAVQRPAPHSA